MYGVVGLILVYEVFFVEAGNRNWIKAARTTRGVLAEVSGAMAGGGGKKVFVVNLPDEYEGAYIFRMGLQDALLMEGVDTAGLVIVSHLRREVEVTLGDSLAVFGAAGGVVGLPPGAVIWKMGADSFRIEVLRGERWFGGRGDRVLFLEQAQVFELGAGGMMGP